MFLEKIVQGVSNRRPPNITQAKQYAAEIKEATTIVQQQKPQLKETSSEEEPLTKIVELQELDDLQIEYAQFEEQNVAQINYDDLFSYLEHHASSGDDYQPEAETSEQTTSVMSDEEAEETVQKIQLSYLTGDKDNVSYAEKEKFHHWQKFNATLLMLYHQLSPLRTDNVDYSAV
ncbi:hypothetical protein GOV03_01815 [Candidatus Woesearchaeota archaeon]|nr:hypothetical protein [Candidatus Woesearchaeota archaeon]